VKDIIGDNPPSPAAQVKTLTIEEDGAGQRLDNFLLRELKGVPKTHVYRIIRSGEVRVNKGRVSADYRIGAGDLIRLPPVRTSDRADAKAHVMAGRVAAHPAAGATTRAAAAREFVVLFEDDHLLAIDKPAGVAVHGGSGVSFGVIEQLRMSRPQAKFLELVHRLDRETSGILLVAKKRSALTRLQDQFRARETGKTYLAMVAGQWPARNRVLDKPLHKYLLPDGERRVRVTGSDDPDAMPALTLVRLREALATGYSLLEVTIRTGRTHQIRVHLSHEGFPIVGDDKYGNFELNRALLRADAAPQLRRMFLHAWRLQFNHPASDERIELLANLPPDLEAFSTHAAVT
jgi:23S rRNA pseudouridine955/2504/2580 synthase